VEKYRNPRATEGESIFIFNDYDGLRDARKPKENNRIVNIDKEKYEINSLHVNSCYDFICKEIFVVRLSKNHTESVNPIG
jgi:hypothetical protein